MFWDKTRELLESRVADGSLSAPVYYENADAPKATDLPFLLTGLVVQSTRFSGIGMSRTHTTGLYDIEIHVDKESGSKGASEIADELHALFAGQTLTFENASYALEVRCQELSFRSRGNNGRAAIFAASISLLIVYTPKS